MSIDPADTHAPEIMALYEGEHLLVATHLGLWKPAQKLEYLGAPFQSPARDFAHDKGMTNHLAANEESGEFLVPMTQMVDPDGGVDEDQAARRAFRLGIRRRRFSVPPRSARRRAAARLISVSNPACTRAVF